MRIITRDVNNEPNNQPKGLIRVLYVLSVVVDLYIGVFNLATQSFLVFLFSV